MLSFICNTAQGGCGRIRADYEPIEAWVLAQVFARLDVPDVQASLVTPQEWGDEEDLRHRIADDERLLERLDDDFADGVLDRPRYLRQVDRVQQRLDGLRRELVALQREVFVIDSGGRGLRAVWDEHDATWRRALLGDVIEKVVVEPHPAGMTSHLSRRGGEDDVSYKSRRKEHREKLLAQRVHAHWKH